MADHQPLPISVVWKFIGAGISCGAGLGFVYNAFWHLLGERIFAEDYFFSMSFGALIGTLVGLPIGLSWERRGGRQKHTNPKAKSPGAPS
jgi:hypothetical protein